MARCRMLADVGRRQFLRGGTLAAAGAAATLAAGGEAKAAGPAPARVTYPSNRLANVADLKANEPVEVAYPDADAPGVLLKLGRTVPGGVGPDGDIVGFTTICPHKGFPLALQRGRPDPELPRPLFALRLRSGRPADLGPGHPEPPAVRAARRRQGRHLRRGRRRAALRPPVQRALREDEPWLTSARSTGCRSSRRTPRSTTSSATTASSAAATRPTPGP